MSEMNNVAMDNNVTVAPAQEAQVAVQYVDREVPDPRAKRQGRIQGGVVGGVVGAAAGSLVTALIGKAIRIGQEKKKAKEQANADKAAVEGAIKLLEAQGIKVELPKEEPTPEPAPAQAGDNKKKN